METKKLAEQILLNGGIIIEKFWHENVYPDRYSVEYSGQYYTLRRDFWGNPISLELGCEDTPIFRAYKKQTKS